MPGDSSSDSSLCLLQESGVVGIVGEYIGLESLQVAYHIVERLFVIELIAGTGCFDICVDIADILFYEEVCEVLMTMPAKEVIFF